MSEEVKKVVPPKPLNMGGSYVRDAGGNVSPNLKDPAMKARDDARKAKEAAAKAKTTVPGAATASAAAADQTAKEVKGNVS